jgi:hypothetical protein
MTHKSKEVVELAKLLHEYLDKMHYNTKPLMYSSLEDEIAIPIVTDNKKLVVTIKKVHKT